MKDRDLPEIANRGTLIDPADPYPEIRRHAEKNREWDYSEEIAYLNRKFDQFKERFFDAWDELEKLFTLSGHRFEPGVGCVAHPATP